MSGPFTLSIMQHIAKAKDKANVLVEEVVAYSVEQIDQRSPVGNPARWKHPERAPEGYVGGRFRGNWQLGVDTVPQGVVDRVDPAGTTTVTAAISNIPEQAAGHVYYYANNLPYAIPLEYGHSTLAPSPGGIVGLTLIDARNHVDAVVRSLP